MYYVVYYKDTLKVSRISVREPNDLLENQGLARCEIRPRGLDFTVANLQNKTETYTVQEEKEVVKTDEQGNEYTETEYVDVKKTRKYQVCDLISVIDEKAAIRNKISQLKKKLADTDYKAIKFAEGVLTAEEYAETKALRETWRKEINELEGGEIEK